MSIALFLVVVPNIIVSASTHRSRGADFRCYLIAGERFLSGEFLYADSHVASNVTWPPFFAVFIVPFSLLARLSVPLSQVVWYLLTIGLYFLTIAVWTRLLWDRPLAWFRHWQPLSLYDARIAVPFLLSAGLLLENFVRLQTMTLMLFLLSMALWSEKRGNNAAAGAWIGIAVAIKAFPVLMVPYYLYRKNVKALVWLTVTAGALTLLPALRYGWDSYVVNMAAWMELSFSGGYPLTGLNQSVYAWIGRWVAQDPFVAMRIRLAAPPADAAGAVAATWLYRGLYGALIVGFVALLHARKHRSLPLEGGFWILTSAMFSPLCWTHYYILAFPAYALLFDACRGLRSRPLAWVIGVSCALLTIVPFLGNTIPYVRGFAHHVVSNYTVGGLVILGGLLYLAARHWAPQGQPACPDRP